MTYLVWILLGAVFLFLAYQGWIVLSARRMRGQAAPDIVGDIGQRIENLPIAVLYFYSDRCHNCRAMEPLVEALSLEFDNLFKLDAVEEPVLAHKFRVRATPTIIRVRDGVIDEVLLGRANEARLRALLA